ncbi:MAG: hypothetical protein D6726_12100, partial [Nitrospirae bacterium]
MPPPLTKTTLEVNPIKEWSPDSGTDPPLSSFFQILLAGYLIDISGHPEVISVLSPLIRYLKPPDPPLTDTIGHQNITCLLNASCHFEVTKDGTSKGTFRSVNEAVISILFEMVEEVYRNRPLQAVFHAGACGFADTAVIFGGGCGAGKSTIVAGLQSFGWKYLSDDLCLIGPSKGRLLPLPLPQPIK